ncbi:hypothetical protein M4951_17585 [Blastopirellula sp. J2-11]|uniref:hypothetical protein n=1 Tax=Blastopirellula sp. J2-11 TaxID=2943192 RepID=UPI0021C678FB|nr:hypothetical protein [Blastopirellula sp. J2-11]UUO05184.1 hypothetical protein M4951_17585 [Blastopirellula sp. J2-11]
MKTLPQVIEEAQNRYARASSPVPILNDVLNKVSGDIVNILSCDFAEHGILVIGSQNPLQHDALAVITLMRGFFNGRNLFDVVSKSCDAFLHADVAVVPRGSGEAILSRELGCIVLDTLVCCCKRQLKEAGYMVTDRSQLTVKELARSIRHEIIKHYKNNFSDRPGIAQQANRAAEQEAQWQLDRIATIAQEMV